MRLSWKVCPNHNYFFVDNENFLLTIKTCIFFAFNEWKLFLSRVKMMHAIIKSTWIIQNKIPTFNKITTKENRTFWKWTRNFLLTFKIINENKSLAIDKMMRLNNRKTAYLNVLAASHTLIYMFYINYD